MAFVAPHTWTVSEIITTILLNTEIRDQLRYLKGLDGATTIENGLIVDNTDGDEYFQLPNLTTTERDALTAVDGMVIYNETLHKVQARINSTWLNVTTGAGKMFIPATFGSNSSGQVKSHYAAKVLGSTNIAAMSFIAPVDFSSISEMVIVAIADTTDASHSLATRSDYGTEGEAHNLNSSNATPTPSVTATQIFEIDVSGLFGSLAANDYCGVEVTNNETAQIYVLGLRLKYN